MGHGHDHHHHGDSRGALALALVLNGGFLVVEAGVGWWSGSLALLSDAVHMVGDVAALVLALGAAQLARGRPGPDRTFGLRRAEVLGGFVNGLAMLLACAWIAWEAVGRLAAGAPDVPGLPILVVGLVGLAINLGSVAVLLRSGADDLNVRGALLHMAADALGSVGAVLAAGLVMAGVPAADPVVSLAIAGLVLWSTGSLLRDTGRVLLQLPPVGLDVRALRDTLVAVPGVASVHDLHVWTLDGQRAIVTAHLVCSDAGAPDTIRQAALTALEAHHGVGHATLAVEAAGAPCLATDCEDPAGDDHDHAHDGHAHPHDGHAHPHGEHDHAHA